MSDPHSTPPHLVPHVRSRTDESAREPDRDRVAASPPPASLRRHALQPGIEDLLERLRVSDTRRSGAMDRLESMLDQWSETDERTHLRRERSNPSRPPADVVSMIRPPQMGDTPLMAFASEAVSQSPTSMFLRARGLTRLERQPSAVVSWRPDAGRDREEPRRSDEAPLAPPPPQRDAVHAVAGRLDALELALVVTKGELDRVAHRQALQQRRSLAAAVLVCACVVLVCVVIGQSERRADRMRAEIAVAQQQAERAARQADELATALRRVTDASAFVPR